MTQSTGGLTKEQRDAIFAELKKALPPAKPPIVSIAERVLTWRTRFRAYRKKGFSWEQLVGAAKHPKIKISTTATTLARHVGSKKAVPTAGNLLTTEQRNAIFEEAMKDLKPDKPPFDAIVAELQEWEEQARALHTEGYDFEQIAGLVAKPDVGIAAKAAHIRALLAPTTKKKTQ